MKLTAKATRCEGWWAIEVPELNGLFTQTRRLDQIPAMVKDAAALLTDRPETDFEVTVEPQLDGDLAQIAAEAKARAAEAAHAQEEASRLSRKLARTLAATDVTVRDIGAILGVSHQRVHQILHGQP